MQLRIQRLLAILLGLYLVVMAGFYGISMFCYNPLAESMRQADVQWQQVQQDCLDCAGAVPGLMKTAQTLPGFDTSSLDPLQAAQTTFSATPVPANQPPPNPQAFALCQKVQDGLLTALQAFVAAAAAQPALQADPALKTITEKLADVPKARAAFNEKAVIYNARVDRFPDKLITIPFCFLEKPLFKLTARQ
ncbi:MAG: LemA family protein [Chthoniobacteraceae bacterium]